MTTVLHRSSDEKHLHHDYTVKNKAMKGRDDKTPETKARALATSRKIATILHDHHPVNMGQGRAGSLAQHRTFEQLLEGMKNLGGLSACVFDNQQNFRDAIREIRDANLGQSVTVGGDVEQIFALCNELGLVPHTAIVSLGIWGKTALLPRPGVKELTMMCGHGLLGANRCEALIRAIKAGRMTPAEAAASLATGCSCGAVNPSLAETIFSELSQKEE